MRERYSPTLAQQRILNLVCEGRTNKEIGAALQISPSTVAKTITHMRLEIGMYGRNKAALATAYIKWLSGEEIPGWNVKPNES